MMSKTPIRWGILGTSYISEVMAKAICESDTGKLLAIGSRENLTAKRFAEKYSISKYYPSYQLLLNDDEIDAVYIGLPNHLHKEWMIRAALAGKHILCEKPLVISVEEAEEVISHVKRCRVFCMEAFMYQFHPFIKKLQEIVENKMIGEIKLYTATYTANIAEIANQTAGGSIRNLGCYPLSLVRLLANSVPIEIRAMGRVSEKNAMDNQASVLLQFPDHSMAVISTADDIEMFWQFDVYGAEGNLKIITNPWLPNQDNNKMLIYRNNEKNPIEINVKAEKSLYTYQIDSVNQSILSQDYALDSEKLLQDSLGNTRILEAWLQQVKAMVDC